MDWTCGESNMGAGTVFGKGFAERTIELGMISRYQYTTPMLVERS